ncbi:hypothetical protein CCR95_21345 [Thiocystis minor]|nr:hypothetical protein [Thiocystis minor]
MATPHTTFIADLIRERLQAHSWDVAILTSAPVRFKHDWYIVICPQMFSRLPPNNKRIAFQMEQSVSSRWFSKRYLRILRSSFAVLEYSLTNVAYLEGRDISFPKVHYLPIGASMAYADATWAGGKDHDVLFYGDSMSSARRQSMLHALQQHFDVRIINELFGEEMQTTIRRARVVINLHYYEGALLEMPRIQECLSLGVPVVSESSQDQEDYPELGGAVNFFEQGSVPAMVEAVKAALAQPVSGERLASAVALGERRFAFMFDRFLIAQGFLPIEHAQKMEPLLPTNAAAVAISLPETIRRRNQFNQSILPGCQVFDGMRRSPGWVGCGLSYQAIARHALRNNISQLLVMEDDVVLPADYEEKIAIVREFLGRLNDQWDLFSGVIAALHPDTRIKSVASYKGMKFVTVDRMTSTVFNIYNKRALTMLTEWDPKNQDAEANTIDRYLGTRQDLLVVVALPFLVGHREEVHSTLWGFKNTGYSAMISSSEQDLSERSSLL